MKLKSIKQQLSELIEQSDAGDTLDLAAVAKLKVILQDKKIACQHKLRHGVDFEKRSRAERKLKKVKACLKQIKLLEAVKPPTNTSSNVASEQRFSISTDAAGFATSN